MRSFRLTSLVAGAALSVSVGSFAGHAVLADSVESVPAETGNGDPVCRSDDIGIERKPSDMSEGVCPEHATETHETARARAYLIETATPGYTMTRQGPERAIGRLHPEFVRRLAAAIADARVAGLPFAGIFSAYRPPAFGIGGFADKPPQTRTAILVDPRTKTASNRTTPKTAVSTLDAMRWPPVSGGKIGWPKGVPRIAQLDDKTRKRAPEPRTAHCHRS